ncbi:MAG: hypothetical protein VZQ51_09175 [Bacteroidales bacterium]|nr:hypothetical protein [Bacteroidales bacterium]
MKFIKLLIVLAAFFTACEHKPEPNVYLVSSYDLLKKGDLDTAKLLVEKAERKSEADDALYYLVRGAVAAATLERSYRDFDGAEKCISFFEGDDEKSAWAHFIKGELMYKSNRWEEAAVEWRTAEKLAAKTSCDELKFHVYLKLVYLNTNSGNFDGIEFWLEQMQKHVVTNFDKSEFYYQKCFIPDMPTDSVRFYAEKAVEYAEKSPKFYAGIYKYYKLAEVVMDKDDSLSESLIIKSFDNGVHFQGYSILGQIYLRRGDIKKAEEYFSKSTDGVYWVNNEIKINRLLGEFYAGKNDYKTAYGHALLSSAAKDTLIAFYQNSGVKTTQTKFADEIENLKLKSAFEKKIFLTISVSAVILAVLILTVVFQKLKLSERSRKIFEAQQTINGYNQKIKDLQNTSQDKDDSEIKFLQQKVQALEQKFSDVYVRGKELYSQILSDKKIGRWSKEDYKNFIDYYQSVDFLFVYGFETDYVSLTDRQKIFLILLHIGKTKEQVMQIMTIEDVTFRSMKSRCEGQKK